MMHPGDDLLQRYLDDEVPVTSRDRISAHLAICPRCERRWRELEDLMLSLQSLPASITPPADLWTEIESRIRSGEESDGVRGDRVAAERTGSLHDLPATVDTAASPDGDNARGARLGETAAGARILPFRRRGRLPRAAVMSLAAAAILLVGFALGRVIPRPSAPVAIAPGAVYIPPVTSTPADRSVTTVSLLDDDVAYDQSIAELHTILAAMNDDLLPETVAAIEENLRIIDTAIEEARAALAADPASDYLRRRISIHRQTKLDVLRAATSVVTTSEI